VSTTEPGVQFYSGNNLDFERNGFERRGAFCLETQHFPDSPNQPQFPSTTLRPGRTYESTTVFIFGVTP
jgi:aldose 1-epimerase